MNRREPFIFFRAAALLLLLPLTGMAQLGPIEPIIVTGGKPSETLVNIPELGGDFTVFVEVTVGTDGSVKDATVTRSSDNGQADAVAISFIKEKKFLPALDANAQPVEAKAWGRVDVMTKTRMKQLKAFMKPPDIPSEIERVRKLTCRDFNWEIDRLRNQGGSTDLGHEIMPWVSLRVYMLDKKLPKGVEDKYLEKWPQALAEAETMCQSTPGKLYLKDTLVLILDSLAPNH